MHGDTAQPPVPSAEKKMALALKNTQVKYQSPSLLCDLDRFLNPSQNILHSIVGYAYTISDAYCAAPLL